MIFKKYDESVQVFSWYLLLSRTARKTVRTLGEFSFAAQEKNRGSDS